MRTCLLSAVLLAVATTATGADAAKAVKASVRRPPVKKAPARKAKAKPAAKQTAAKQTTATPAKSMPDTCEFQVRTRSKVGYRGMATYWVKGEWIREEKRSGGGMELIMVNNDQGLFIRNKHSNYWFRYPEEMAVKLRERLLGGPVGEVRSFLKKVKASYLGKEKVEGVLCNIWAYRLPGARDKFRLWTDLKNTRPVRMERDHIVRGTKKRDVLVVEYKRYTAGQPLEDSLFQVPVGQKVHDLRDALRPSNLRKRASRRSKQERQGQAAAPATTPAPPATTSAGEGEGK